MRPRHRSSSTRPLRVLVACEFSGAVRDAFTKLGHDALSCDVLPSEKPGPHYQGDVRDILREDWDLVVAFPPCTYLCSSGLHWNSRRRGRAAKTKEALAFVRLLMDAPVRSLALENPVGCISTQIRKPDQVVQPWMFGHPESKTTCLWLRGLPPLKPTRVLTLPESGRWANQTPTGAEQPFTKSRQVERPLPNLRRFGASNGEAMERRREARLTPLHSLKPMNPSYSNTHVELVDRHRHMADARVLALAKWTDKSTEAIAEKDAHTTAFIADPSEANAVRLVEVTNRIRNLQCIEAAIESVGGRAKVREQALTTDPVFDAFAKAFTERAGAVEKQKPGALKKLGARRAELSEAAVHFTLIERDPVVCAWRDFHDALVVHLARAVFGQKFSIARGKGAKNLRRLTSCIFG